MNSFIHHDSMEGVNSEYATRLYDAVKGFVWSSFSSSSLPKSFLQDRHNKKKDPPLTKFKVFPAVPGFIECLTTPQQCNGYECGLYVMAIARIICQWHARKSRGKETESFSEMKKHVSVSSVETTMRSEVVQIIEELRAHQD